MSPEFGSTIAVFPIDEETIEYLQLTGRPDEQLALVEAYAKEQGLWHDPAAEPRYSERLELDLATVVPSLAGPKRPQDRVEVTKAGESFEKALKDYTDDADATATVTLDGETFEIDHGAVAIAAITSCTNTSNPSVMIGAALLAKNAVEKGLQRKPWVKTTLAPGLEGGQRLLRARRPHAVPRQARASTSSATAARRASATPARSSPRSATRSTRTTWPWSACCPATATSRAGSTPT